MGAFLGVITIVLNKNATSKEDQDENETGKATLDRHDLLIGVAANCCAACFMSLVPVVVKKMQNVHLVIVN